MLTFCTEITALYTKLSTYIDKICPCDYYKDSVFFTKVSQNVEKGRPDLSQIILICESSGLPFVKNAEQ